MLLIAIPVGLLIGVSLGALGGGSILTVPALVYLLNQSPHAATTGSLLIVGITAIAATVAHLRNGRVRIAQGLTFGVLGVAGSWAGRFRHRVGVGVGVGVGAGVRHAGRRWDLVARHLRQQRQCPS